MKNVVLPAWELIFQKFRRISCFFFVGGHFRNSSFTCMGAHFSRICLKFRWPFFKDRNRKKMMFLRLSLFPLRARNGRVWRAFWHKLLGETSLDAFEMLSRRSTLALTETPLRSLRTARWRGWAKPTGYSTLHARLAAAPLTLINSAVGEGVGSLTSAIANEREAFGLGAL